ncbi:hypothetical protein Sango_2643900 [Sesamum angolense]|uniref:Reverse transcriptase domain-containing protein n=1 Tax=Sesamum angolense TaxID=2727404 RepID=A0AAE1W1Y4_9LAMI|nr:hypothetical protein Sango_2643900 [Sesamum angolense]
MEVTSQSALAEGRRQKFNFLSGYSERMVLCTSKLNSTDIVLIPKFPNPESLTQYKPISLCNVIYKLAYKTIASRLKPLLDSLISPSHSSFVPGRSNINNILLTYETNHFLGHKVWGKEGHVSLKLDVSKAYDNVEWTFLEKGSLAKLPVIPYLYLFCVEAFSAAIRRALYFTWRSILSTQDLLVAGLHWKIGDGQTTVILGNLWLPRPHTFQLIHRPKSLQQDSKVAVLITTERSWNLDMIREEFLAEDAECILSIPLSADQTNDAIVWHYGENGCFSVKSAYEVAMRISNQASTSTDQADWCNVWRKKIPPQNQDVPLEM